MAFFVGQKVVCVDDYSEICDGKHPDINKGAIYTIARVGLRAWTDKTPAVEVREIPRHPFYARRFRPVVEKKSGIEILNRIRLGGPPEPAKEDAVRKIVERT